MSKSPKRKASGGAKRKPVTIDMEAEKKPAEKEAASTANKTAQSTPRVGRDASRKAETASKPAPKPEPKPKPAAADTQKQPAPTAAKSSGGLGHVAAGIIGGAVALGGGAAAQYAGVLPSFGGTASVSGFATEAALRDANAGLETRLASLQEQLDGLKSAPAPAPAPAAGLDMAQVQKAIDDSLSSARSAEPAMGIPDDVATQISTVEERATKLETALSETQTKVIELTTASDNDEPDPQVTALSDRVDIVAGNLATLKQDVASEISKEGVDPVAVTALGATVAGITAKLSTIDSRVADMATRTETLPSDVASTQVVEDRIIATKSALDSNLSELSGQVDTLSQGLQSQGQLLAALEAKLADGADKRAARALIAAQLKGEVDRGQSFASTLETFRTSTGDREAYAAIAPFAESGILPIDVLASQFDGSVGQKILDATMPVSEMSLTDRLLAGAKSLVKVKPIGAVEGAGVNAIVSRISAALANGDGASASAAWATLPPAGKNVSGEWHTSLQARVDADALLNSSVSNFISSTVSN